MEISMIAPCLNEEKNIVSLVKRINKSLDKTGIKGEIILIDDGSRDKTLEVMKKIKSKNKNLIIVKHKDNKGIVESWKSGLKKARGRYIVTIDSDLQYLPEDIPRLYNEIKNSKYDLVQGWRREDEKKDLIRDFLSKTLSFVLNKIFSMNLRDIKSGFIIYKKEVFKDILSYKKDYRLFQHFVTIAAYWKGYKIKQIPVKFAKRKHGKSFIGMIPIKFIVKVLLDIPKAYSEYKLKRL
jgi:phenylacetate-CoA ligase